MSLLAMAAVWRAAPPTWPAGTRLVALALADHVDDATGCAWPSIATLCERTGLSARMVRYALAAVVEAGWASCEPRYVEGHQRSNLWHWQLWLGRLAAVDNTGGEAVDNGPAQAPLVGVVEGSGLQPVAGVGLQPVAGVGLQPVAARSLIRTSIEPSPISGQRAVSTRGRLSDCGQVDAR